MDISTLIGRLALGPRWAVVEQAKAQPETALSLPATITLDGVNLLLRGVRIGDAPAILAFARALPAHDLLFLRRDITSSVQVDAVLRDAETGLAVTVLAFEGQEVVGYATIASDGLSWTQHVRELRVLVAERMRGKHLGRLLIEQSFAIARMQGAKKMIAQMTVDQRGAIGVFRRMGFEPEARLRSQVIDRSGQLHDLQIMGLDIDAFEARLEVAVTQPTEV
ncbi:MAG TPA: GNAT family N-acetyltransferase [Tepidiformaceae bacterium]|jgi:L-amino acid N-acyltransferase YncA